MNKPNIPYRENFKVPTDYFNTVEDDVMAKITTASWPKKAGFKTPEAYFELEMEIAPQLEHMTFSKKGFNTPDTYFEDEKIENKVMEQLIGVKKPSKVIQLKSLVLERLIPLAVAASLALFVYTTFDDSLVNFNGLANSDFDEWMDEGLISLSEDDITAVYADVDFTNDQFFEDEDVIDYLDGTDIENLLIEE